MMESPIASTSIFSVSAATYVSTIMNRWIEKWWWILAIPSLFFIALGATHSQEFYYVAIMFTFLMYPGIMMLVYANHAVTVDACAEILPHRISFFPEYISIEHFTVETDEEGNENYLHTKTADIPYISITNYTDTGKAIILEREYDRMSVIIIPNKAASPEETKKITDILYKSLCFNKI